MSRDSEGVNNKIPNGKDLCPQPNAMERSRKIGTKTSTELPPTSGDSNDVQYYGRNTEEGMPIEDDD